MNFKKSLCAVAIATCFSFAGQVHANSTSNVIGTVKAKSLSGVTVVITDPQTGFHREVSPSQSGDFRFAQLDPGLYEIKIMRGERVLATDKLKVKLGQNASSSFDLSADSPEVIEISGSRVQAVDVSTMDSGLVIGEAELDLMPVARNLTSIALLAPGTVLGDSRFSGANNGGLASFGGSSVAENSCYINGLEVTDTSQGLGCGSVPFEFYKDFQVKTGGYSAKFGRTTGGLINSITKSGTNDWEFAATANFTPDALREDGQISSSAGGPAGPEVFRNKTRNEYQKTEFTLSASGPLIEDTLFVYALINPRDVENNNSTQSSSRAQFTPDNRYYTDHSQGNDNLFWGAKIDWQINDDHRLSYFAYSDRTDVLRKNYEFNGETGEIGKHLGDTLRKRGGEVQSVNYVGNFTEDFTVNALLGKIETEYTNIPGVLDCPTVADNRADIPESQKIKSCGPGGSMGENRDNTKQGRLDFEYYFEDHTFRVGYDWQKRDTFHTSSPITGHSWSYKSLQPNATIQGTNGPLYTNNTGAAIDYVEDRIFSGGGAFTTELSAYYIEDEWQITDQILLNIGFRRDEFENKGVTNAVFSKFKTDISPRLGFSWDYNGDGESKFYGTWGRYYLPVPNNTNYRAASGISDSTTFYRFTGSDSTGAPTGLTPINGDAANSVNVNSRPTPATIATFQAEEAEPFSKDELIIGWETQFSDDLSFGINGIYRTVSSALDDYCGIYASPASCTLVNPGKGGTWALDTDGDGLPDAGSKRTYTAAEIGLPDAENEYYAVQTKFAYRAENFQIAGSYTWSRSYGNFEGAVKSDIAQADPGITQDFDFPALMDGAKGYQANDRRHVFKAYGTYELTDNWTVGFNSVLSSGRPLSMFGQGYPIHDGAVYGSYGDTFYLYTNNCPDTNGDGACQQEEKVYKRVPRGTAGRTPWMFNLDISTSYMFKVGDVDMRATLQVYNVLNAASTISQVEHYEARGSEGKFNPHYGAATEWQAPRYVELAFDARF